MVELKLKSGIVYNLKEIKEVNLLEGNRIEIIANLNADDGFRSFLLNMDNVDKKSMKKMQKYLQKDRVSRFLDM